MKTTFKFIKLLAFTLLITFYSCSSDDDTSSQISTPVIGVNSTNVDVTFFTEGSLAAPSVTWGGEVGSFELATPISGVNVNAVTGVISYSKSLPVGESNISLIARNSAGQTTQTITINSMFSGSFTGEYTNGDNDNYGRTHKSVYNADGSYNGEDNDDDAQVTFGTWTRSGNTITASYSYGSVGDNYSITVDLTNTDSDAILEGSWFSYSTFGGYIRFSID